MIERSRAPQAEIRCIDHLLHRALVTVAFNHYLPRRLLRGFVDSRGFISGFDCERDVPIPPVALGRIGGQNGLYPDTVENELERVIEHPFNVLVLEKIENRQSLKREDVHALIDYSLALIRRVPAGLIRTRDAFATMPPHERATLVQQLLALRFAETGEELSESDRQNASDAMDEVLTSDAEGVWHDTLLSSMPRSEQYLRAKKWDCLIAPPHKQVLIGDNPAVLGVNTVGEAGGGLILPIASNLVLCASQRPGPLFRYARMSATQVHAINQHVIAGASRFVFFRQYEYWIGRSIGQARSSGRAL